jgi:hypothetical protein
MSEKALPSKYQAAAPRFGSTTGAMTAMQLETLRRSARARRSIARTTSGSSLALI